MSDVSSERLERFFCEENSHFCINKEIREMVVFASQNLLLDPPFTRLDLLSCRNLLIYLTAEAQQKLIPLFHYALNPEGLLFLGSSETIGDHADLFEVVDSACKIYRRKVFTAAIGGRVEIPITPTAYPSAYGVHRTQGIVPLPREGESALLDLTQRMLLESFTPPAALVTEKGDILYIHGRTGNYLELPAGKANMNLFAMAREGLRLELGNALHQAVKQQTEVVTKGIRVKTNGDYETIDLTVRPIHEPEGLRGLLMVVFQSVAAPERPTPRRRSKIAQADTENIRITELEKELKATQEHLQSAIEQMDTSREELESINEELQSTNEEMMTSREEMQSLNEELLTVNAELSTKNEELSHAYDDMKNLLNGTQIATIFLDNRLNIKRFTPSISQIVNLIPSDVGRPIGDIALKLRYEELEDLVADAKQVLETLIFKETQVQTKDTRWYQMRIWPYRTLTNIIDGVVITFMDITQLKLLESRLIEREAMLKESRDYAANIIATLREPFLVLDGDMQVVSANRAFYAMFRTTPEETERRSLYHLGDGQWNIPDLKRLLEEILPQQTEVQGFKVEHDFPAFGRRVVALNARQLYREPTAPSTPMILLAMEDITLPSEEATG